MAGNKIITSILIYLYRKTISPLPKIRSFIPETKYKFTKRRDNLRLKTDGGFLATNSTLYTVDCTGHAGIKGSNYTVNLKGEFRISDFNAN